MTSNQFVEFSLNIAAYKPRSKNSTIPNRQPQSKQTTQPLLELQTTPSSNANPAQWTCGFTGSTIASDKTNSSSTGDPALRTSATTSPSITQHLITASFASPSSS
jgi:hypothetical protein